MSSTRNRTQNGNSIRLIRVQSLYPYFEFTFYAHPGKYSDLATVQHGLASTEYDYLKALR